MRKARRLDHLICETDDIQRTFQLLCEAGYPEAWPIGPFWPNALTAGIALGGFNLELLQPLDREPVDPPIQTLVFEPGDEEAGSFDYEVKVKIESDPQLLLLRGFTQTESQQPQTICTNVFPQEPPFPFFFCEYAPGLKTRLGPEAFPVPDRMRVREIVYGLANYDEAQRWIKTLGLDQPPLRFVPSERNGVTSPLPI